jgi:hypothetical protein
MRNKRIITQINNKKRKMKVVYLVLILFILFVASCHPNNESTRCKSEVEELKTINNELVSELLHHQILLLERSITKCYNLNNTKYENSYLLMKDIVGVYDEMNNTESTEINISLMDTIIDYKMKNYIDDINLWVKYEDVFENKITNLNTKEFNFISTKLIMFNFKVKNSLLIISLNTCSSELDMDLKDYQIESIL